MANRNDRKKRSSRTRRKKDQNHKSKGWLREWFDALLFAAIAAIIIRTFFFQAYTIPTPSMERTLLTGDYLIVSKIDYGPRTPMVLGIPFTNMYLPGVSLPWTRLPGFGKVDRNDIVVFNYPIDYKPISAKTNYIKRCVGLPGDTLAMKDAQLFVNHHKSKTFPGIEHGYIVHMRNNIRLSKTKVHEAGGTIARRSGSNTYEVFMDRKVKNKISKWQEVNSVEPYIIPDDVKEFSGRFHFSSGFQNHHQIPAFVVPFKGEKVHLTPKNYHIYQNIIERYEHNTVVKNGDQFTINGKKTNEYTIKSNYYFMMGDNRDNSEDSRFWGFVPKSHIVGEAGMIYFSWDKNRWLPRFGRIFNFI